MGAPLSRVGLPGTSVGFAGHLCCMTREWVGTSSPSCLAPALLVGGASSDCDVIMPCVRVKPEELARVRNRIVKQGDRYGGANLDAAIVDARYALENAGFTFPKMKKTGELKRMVTYTCSPDWDGADQREVVRRLEKGWVEDGAFEHEAHSTVVEEGLVALDFVTWWEGGAFYTGRIEVTVTSAEGPLNA
jgi:hypothetical protein